VDVNWEEGREGQYGCDAGVGGILEAHVRVCVFVWIASQPLIREQPVGFE